MRVSESESSLSRNLRISMLVGRSLLCMTSKDGLEKRL